MTFETRYQKLNEKQRQAVDSIYWPVMVIAWPWSGKTELLAVRIANILKKTDAMPYNILCLTFTEAAAHNMRERLRRIIGSDAYKVNINTFHSFGNELLNRFKYQFETPNDGILDTISEAEIFHEIIKNLTYDNPWRKSASGESGIIYNLREAIKNLKGSGISPWDFENILKINEQLLTHICPIIENNFKIINSLWQKKAEKEQKVEIFAQIFNQIIEYLSDKNIKYKWLFDHIGNTFLESMKNVIENSDAKSITAWRNKYMSTDVNKDYRLKEWEKMEKSFALLDIYRSYENILHSRGLKDFSDMIIRMNELIETNPLIQAQLSEQYQWIMIDEYQDTNKAQLAMISNITRGIEMPNIFVVGDDDQSIYKFQWANTENLNVFCELFPETELIILEKNYRSFEEIINFSRDILTDKNSIEKIFPQAQKHFDAFRGKGGIIEKYEFHTEIDELSFVAEQIEKLIEKERNNKDFKLSEIAIISRKNDILERAWKFLLQKNIPIFLSKDENIFDNEVVQILVKILRYIASLNTKIDRDDLLVEIISHQMWGLHRLDIWEISRKIYHAQKEEKKTWIEVLKNHNNQKIAKIAYFLIELSLLSRNSRLEDIIDTITWAKSLTFSDDYYDEADTREQSSLNLENDEQNLSPVFYEYYFNEEKLKKNPLVYANFLANLRKFIDSIRSYKQQKTFLTLNDFEEYISLIEKYKISLTTSTLIGTPDAIQCITGHKSKGLEYKYVFAIGLTKSNFLSGRKNSSPFPSNLVLQAEQDNEEDVERLIYTICTRAKNFLSLSYSLKDFSEKSTELVPVLAHIEDFKKIEQLSIKNIQELLENENKNIITLPFTGDESLFIKNLTEKFELSVSALQNFLNIVDAGPEYFLSKNILRFPQAKNEYASFGSAIHAALENIFKNYSFTKKFDKEILFSSFHEYFKNEWFPLDIEKLWREKWEAILEWLFEYLQKDTYGKVTVEYIFGSDKPRIDDFTITGRIDRIDEINAEEIRIVDYKTWKSLDNLDITDSGNHDNLKKWKYDTQLIFYAVLFQNSYKWKHFRKKNYELLFVEPNKKTGEYKKITKYVQQEEILRMEKLIIAVMKHIRELNFPDISWYTKDVKWIRQFEEDLINGII